MAPLLLLLPLSLALSPPAHAAKKKKPEAADHHETDDASGTTATAPTTKGDGSIWDYIEAPVDPSTAVDARPVAGAAVPIDTEAVEASEELAEARQNEASLIGETALHAPPVDFYTDPVGTLADDPLHLRKVDPSEFDIPVVVNDAVIRWMEYFTGRGRKYYHRYLSRSTRYQPMMKEKLRAAGLPEDLVYLSMIESGYNPHAYSTAAAAGLWQFITSTGQMYDLRVDFWVDERRNPELSTDAAIRLLSDLYGDYGDWYLAWAAYNAGPGRVNRALERYGKNTDFWTMVDKGSFRPETDNYVPKLLAAAIIGKHPERYGFTDVEYQEPDALEVVEVGASISLDVLARCADITEEELQRLNPHLRRWALPPEPNTQQLWLPAGKGTSFLAALERVPAEERLSFVHHKVAKGETLGRIAAKYGVRTEDVQKANRISDPNRISVGTTLVIPRQGGAPPEALTSTAGGSSASSRSTTTSAPAARSSSTSSSSSSGPRTTTATHTVRKGETLSSIAAHYGMKLSDLQRDNGIRDADHVVVGQRLKVRTTAPTWNSYTVRKGDTLSSIAQKHGVTVAQLQADNGISGSRILVGQTLRIRR